MAMNNLTGGLEMDRIHDDGIVRALDAIKAGGEQLVIIARQRISMALDSLDEGEFADAGSYLADALGGIQSLANAQQFIAIADGSRPVKAADVQVGMTLTNVGEVTDMSSEDCPSERCKRHITLKVGDHELEFRGDQEVYVSSDKRASAA